MMYTKLKNVQVIISLLKQNGIRHLVLSPGTRDVPFVHSVEQDSYFKCYSIVDERSAAYFALGLSKQLDEPVCLSCTSSTATCNYMPAVKEAYEKNIQLLLLTADRNNYLLKQGEDQLIVQSGMYGKYVKCSVNLPIVKNENDLLYCVRKVNEALLELNHRNKGPVQINFQIQVIDLCRENVLPTYRKVERVRRNESKKIIEVLSKMKAYKRILFLVGQGYYDSNEKKDIEKKLNFICERYNCVISVEETSNLKCAYSLKTCLVTEAMTDKEFELFLPDLVITLGNHFFSFIKYKLRNNGQKIEHWRVNDNGSYIDNFDALTYIFDMNELEFMNSCIEVSQSIPLCEVHEYFDLWANRINKICFPDLKFSNFSVIKSFCDFIPEDSIIHLTILNSLRLYNFCNKKNTFAFCNLGADGIDGGLSTFLGQVSNTDKLSFLITGDLSFFYDLNSSLISHKNNIRILLINNFAGSEFHNNFGLEKIASLNDYIAAGHKSKAKSIIPATDYQYISASNQNELNEAMSIFVNESNKPILLEVFTDANTDSQVLKKFYEINTILSLKEKIIKITKKFVKKVLKVLNLRK